MNIEKAKNLLIGQGIDIQTIDWTSYSDDIPIEEWLYNEYRITPTDFETEVEKSKNQIEQYKREKFDNSNGVNWKEISKTAKSIAIAGTTGTGKTAIGYKILEVFDKPVYVLKHPRPELLKERGFLPLFRFSDIERLSHCVIWIDEPQLYISYYEKRINSALMRLLSLCRQREITLILSTSDTRFINRGLESYIDVWIIKDLEFDLVKQGSIIKKIIKENTFIIDDGLKLSVEEYIFYSRRFDEFNGKHTFQKPSYFDERYSKPFLIESATKTAKKSAKKLYI